MEVYILNKCKSFLRPFMSHKRSSMMMRSMFIFFVMAHKWPIPHRITRHRHNYTKSVVHTQSQDTIQYSTFGRETAVLKRATLTVFSLKECVVWVSRVESRGWLSAGRPMLH